MRYEEARQLHTDVMEEMTRRAFVVAAKALEESGIQTHHAVVAEPILWGDRGVVITLLILGSGGEHRYRKMIGAAALDAVSEEEISELQCLYDERRSVEEYLSYERITNWD